MRPSSFLSEMQSRQKVRLGRATGTVPWILRRQEKSKARSFILMILTTYWMGKVHSPLGSPHLCKGPGSVPRKLGGLLDCPFLAKPAAFWAAAKQALCQVRSSRGVPAQLTGRLNLAAERCHLPVSTGTLLGTGLLWAVSAGTQHWAVQVRRAILHFRRRRRSHAKQRSHAPKFHSLITPGTSHPPTPTTFAVTSERHSRVETSHHSLYPVVP